MHGLRHIMRQHRSLRAGAHFDRSALSVPLTFPAGIPIPTYRRGGVLSYRRSVGTTQGHTRKHTIAVLCAQLSPPSRDSPVPDTHPGRLPPSRTRRRGITKRPYPRSRKRCLAPALVSKLSPLRRASLPRPSPLALLATVLRVFLAMQHGELLQLTLHARLSVHLPRWR